jgi:hypothetical protein
MVVREVSEVQDVHYLRRTRAKWKRQRPNLQYCWNQSIQRPWDLLRMYRPDDEQDRSK